MFVFFSNFRRKHQVVCRVVGVQWQMFFATVIDRFRMQLEKCWKIGKIAKMESRPIDRSSPSPHRFVYSSLFVNCCGNVINFRAFRGNFSGFPLLRRSCCCPVAICQKCPFFLHALSISNPFLSNFIEDFFLSFLILGNNIFIYNYCWFIINNKQLIVIWVYFWQISKDVQRLWQNNINQSNLFSMVVCLSPLSSCSTHLHNSIVLSYA